MKKNNGITLAILTLSIVILIIIIAVTVNVSTKAIKESKLEDLKTNMLIIQAKAKVYLEEVSFQTANLDESNEEDVSKISEIKSEYLKGTKLSECSEDIQQAAKEAGIGDSTLYYYLTKENLEEMGINIELNDGEYYLVQYDIENPEVVNTKGYKKDGVYYYTLTELNSL